MQRRYKILLVVGIVGLTWAGVWGIGAHQPSFETVRGQYERSDALLLDRHGDLLHEWRVDARGRRLAWTQIKEIAPSLVTAVIAVEDRRFYDHHGIDWLALLGAAATPGSRRGASTITMQVVSLINPALKPSGRHRTVVQKLRQLRAAAALENTWTKTQILEAYLNLTGFRGELRGVAAASRGLFGKEPHGLSLAEAGILTALIRSPNLDVPAIVQRACTVLKRISIDNTCNDIERTAQVLSQAYSVVPRAAWAPHVARHLFAGQGSQARTIRSTIDRGLQKFAKELLQEQLVQLAGQNVRDGAILIADNVTGDVLTYVGNGGAHSSGSYVDAVKARRQAGSTLKPFLYGLAFERKLLTAASLLNDAPIDVVTGQGTYRPGNYDHSFHGIVTARTALASSLNVPAVRTLLLVTEEPFVGLLQKLGFQGTNGAHDFGPSLALGSADVTLWELVNAYRTLARGGTWSPLRLRLDEIIASETRNVFSDATAYLIGDILSDRESRSLAFGLENPLATRFWSAVKTGTSKDMRDNWCIGFSERYTVGVWVGNFSGAPMWNVSGIAGAAPIWIGLMNRLHQHIPSVAPPILAGLVRADVLIKPLGVQRSELFIAGTEAATVESAAHRRSARIIYPAHGMVVALDPDIPGDRQRIFFEASAGAHKTFWSLNGKIVGQGLIPYAWPTTPGRHVLALLDTKKQPLDSISFVVKSGSSSNSR